MLWHHSASHNRKSEHGDWNCCSGYWTSNLVYHLCILPLQGSRPRSRLSLQILILNLNDICHKTNSQRCDMFRLQTTTNLIFGHLSVRWYSKHKKIWTRQLPHLNQAMWSICCKLLSNTPLAKSFLYILWNQYFTQVNKFNDGSSKALRILAPNSDGIQIIRTILYDI